MWNLVYEFISLGAWLPDKQRFDLDGEQWFRYLARVRGIEQRWNDVTEVVVCECCKGEGEILRAKNRKGVTNAAT